MDRSDFALYLLKKKTSKQKNPQWLPCLNVFRQSAQWSIYTQIFCSHVKSNFASPEFEQKPGMPDVMYFKTVKRWCLGGSWLDRHLKDNRCQLVELLVAVKDKPLALFYIMLPQITFFFLLLNPAKQHWLRGLVIMYGELSRFGLLMQIFFKHSSLFSMRFILVQTEFSAQQPRAFRSKNKKLWGAKTSRSTLKIEIILTLSSLSLSINLVIVRVVRWACG